MFSKGKLTAALLGDTREKQATKMPDVKLEITTRSSRTIVRRDNESKRFLELVTMELVLNSIEFQSISGNTSSFFLLSFFQIVKMGRIIFEIQIT